MLSTVDQKLDTPESHQLAPLGSCITRTGAFVQLRLKIEREALIQEYMKEMQHSCEGYVALSDTDDADL
jgi:hypothetical protein